MYLRKAHIYIIGMVLIGFHFAGTSVSVFPESRFPFHRIHGFREPEYSANLAKQTGLSHAAIEAMRPAFSLAEQE